ncbi:helix-turn-helix transcriptional regulator [Flavobacterium sp. MXW15]|uniref:Helix-turn-helix transcriptional regulator n=1 Tax=Xanthomonas chitinilytica TaxID=2989819 RepID=A0ABT3JU85_9XANT|nr:helix-turn-helix transcriptional regulator [Xanthomonas sp. H13-6]MCW4453580.1 helix-turn-helix transcriptional regulator [Flavobacterium sp. MXW15]MCW4472067.1 helix-turn-helix transcriptional regulator [Xanthomonas sp. H13-6]
MNHETVGDVLREWRGRRRWSQLQLACEAGISTRHLSFVENGRAAASRDLLLRLAEPLTMPLRARNRLLLAAGYAPAYAETALEAEGMGAAKAAIDAVLAGHMPFPALAVDRHWQLVAANPAIAALLEGVAPALLQEPVNVLRLSLHPDGLAPRIENLAQWRHHLLERLSQQADANGDPVLRSLHRELQALPAPPPATGGMPADRIAVPLRLRDPRSGRTLQLISTTTVFGTATDVMLSELALECFYPADAQTRGLLMGQASPPAS